MLKDFCHSQENLKKIFNTGLDAVKTASNKVIQKAGEF